MLKPTRDMSSRHEDHLVRVLGGRRTANSGATFRDQMDGKHDHASQTYVFAWDGKSTLGQSVTVSLAMWAKAREQANWAEPLIPLRFYRNERLDQVAADLVVLSLDTFAEILDAANELAAVRTELAELKARDRAIYDQGCLVGLHAFLGTSTCSVCGTESYDIVEP